MGRKDKDRNWTRVMLLKNCLQTKPLTCCTGNWSPFFIAFSKPINQFLTRLQGDIVPKGKRLDPQRPIGHPLYSRVLELEAQLEAYVSDVLCAPALGGKPVMDLLTGPGMKQYYHNQLVDI